MYEYDIPIKYRKHNQHKTPSKFSLHDRATCFLLGFLLGGITELIFMLLINK